MATTKIKIRDKQGGVDRDPCKLKMNKDDCCWLNATDVTMVVDLKPGFFGKTKFVIPPGGQSDSTGVSQSEGTCTYTVQEHKSQNAAADPSIIIEA